MSMTHVCVSQLGRVLFRVIVSVQFRVAWRVLFIQLELSPINYRITCWLVCAGHRIKLTTSNYDRVPASPFLGARRLSRKASLDSRSGTDLFIIYSIYILFQNCIMYCIIIWFLKNINWLIVLELCTNNWMKCKLLFWVLKRKDYMIWRKMQNLYLYSSHFKVH